MINVYQVTYPYIMANVRIQAGQETDNADELPVSVNGQKTIKVKKDKGAIGILTDVYNERGLVGWYQVTLFNPPI
jgi:hypothetical protein